MMINIPLSEWAEQVQPRILQAGLSVIPNCRDAGFVIGEVEQEMQIEFETPQDELMFILRFMG